MFGFQGMYGQFIHPTYQAIRNIMKKIQGTRGKLHYFTS